MQEQVYPYQRTKVSDEQYTRLSQQPGARTFKDEDTNQQIVEVPTPIYRAERRRMQREERKRRERAVRITLREQQRGRGSL